jgi:hypothetical protein
MGGGGAAANHGLCGTDHHEEAVVDIVGVIVVDACDVEEVLALVATGEGFVAVEAVTIGGVPAPLRW